MTSKERETHSVLPYWTMSFKSLQKLSGTEGISNVKYHLAYTFIGLVAGRTKVLPEFVVDLILADLPLEKLETAYDKMVAVISKEAPRIYQLEDYSKGRNFENECKNIINLFSIQRQEIQV